MTLTIGSLFSGIGGLELGLEMAGLGPVLWQVEKDPFRRCVLAHHWPTAERFDDVCTVGASTLAPVDLICGGFPCQDVSSAGARRGLSGSRSGLWREFARVVSAVRPRWVVVENVASGAGLWVDAITSDMGERGYACLPIPISASDVGAPHRRARIFIVAHADRDRKPVLAVDAEVAGSPEPSADAHSHKLRLDEQRLAARRPDGVRDEGETVAGNDGSPRTTSDTDETGREGPGTGKENKGRRGLAGNAGWSPQPGVVPLVHGLSGGMAGRRRRARIRALGDTVVPQCAEVVGWVIRELAGIKETTT